MNVFALAVKTTVWRDTTAKAAEIHIRQHLDEEGHPSDKPYRLMGQVSKNRALVIPEEDNLRQGRDKDDRSGKNSGKDHAIITDELGIPTIGIGSGKFCDLQVLVVNDIIGFAPKPFKHIKVYDDIKSSLLRVFAAYREEVVSGAFPAREHTNLISDEEYEKISQWLSAGH